MSVGRGGGRWVEGFGGFVEGGFCVHGHGGKGGMWGTCDGGRSGVVTCAVGCKECNAARGGALNAREGVLPEQEMYSREVMEEEEQQLKNYLDRFVLLRLSDFRLTRIQTRSGNCIRPRRHGIVPGNWDVSTFQAGVYELS